MTHSTARHVRRYFPFLPILVFLLPAFYVCLVSPIVMSSRLQYSRADLLNLRRDNPIARKTRRALWFHRLLLPNKRRSFRSGPASTPRDSTPAQLRNPTVSVKPRQPRQSPTSVPSILLFNTRSLFNKIDDLKIRVNELKPDLICITETWFDYTTSDASISIPGFDILRQDRDSRGGGVAIYHKSCYRVSFVSSTLRQLQIKYSCLFN